MKNTFKGICCISKYREDKNGNLILTEQIKQENKITKEAIKPILLGKAVFKDTLRIAISTSTDEPSFEFDKLFNIVAIGDPTLVNNSYLFTEATEANPASIIYTNRFTVPGVARDITSLGIVAGTTNQDFGGGNATCYTYLKLDNVLRQEAGEILDVNYKIFVEKNNLVPEIDKNFLNTLETLFLGQSIDLTSYLKSNKFFGSIITPFSVVNILQINSEVDFDTYNDLELSETTVAPTTSNKRYLYGNIEEGSIKIRTRERSINSTTNGEDYSGKCVRGVAIGLNKNFSKQSQNALTEFEFTNNINDWITLITFDKDSDLGNVYSHASDSTNFFYDSNKLASSSWKPNITQDNSTDFPSGYILKATKSGGLGVGEYKVYKTSIDNTYSQDGYKDWSSYKNIAYQEPFVNNCMHSTVFTLNNPSFEDFIYSNRWLYPLKDEQGLLEVATYQRDKGISVITLTDRSYNQKHIFKLSEYSQLGSRIFDLAVDKDNQIIYVASQSGLHKIELNNNNLITTLNSDKCLCVDTGFNQEVFAVFSDGSGTGRLSSSLEVNWNTASDVGGSVITWENVTHIVVDKSSNSYNLVLAEGYAPKNKGVFLTVKNTTELIKYHWWNNTNKFANTEIYPALNNTNEIYHDFLVWPCNNSISVKNGLWVYPGRRVRRGYWTTSSTNVDAYFDTSAAYESDFVLDMTSAEGGPYKHDITFVSSGSLSYTYNTINPTSSVLNKGYLSGGDYIISNFNKVLGSFENNMLGFSDWVKPKLETDGDSYTVTLLFSMGHFTSSTSKYNKTTTYPAINNQIIRTQMLYKISVNETSETINLERNYGWEPDDLGSLAGLAYCPPANSKQPMCRYIVNHDKMLIGFYPANPKYLSGSIFFYSLFRRPSLDLTDTLLKTWSWDGTNWINDPTNIGPGKPLHETEEPLVNGLSISWEDLQASDSVDLVQDQYYTFTRTTTPNMIVADSETPLLDIGTDIYIRPIEYVENETISPDSNGYYNVLVAPGQISEDADWLKLPNNNDEALKVFVDGVQASVLYEGLEEDLVSEEVLVVDEYTGQIFIPVEDRSKSLTINYFYLKKFDETEV